MPTHDHTGQGQLNFWQIAWDKVPIEARNQLQPLITPEGTSRAVNKNAGKTNEDIDDIIQFAAKQQNEYEAKEWNVKIGSHEWKIRNGMSKIMNWVQRFKELGDILVSMDPVHAAPPWAAFRLLLQVGIPLGSDA